ncbi:MetQ/NlpA family ABC transporter substrate-binding protein [Herbaspirillum sp. alder98]|uniref:MetQ/NlpA family ABC transporter substrate-binding protein n=1 Tax=Herbaspirillum sp. alder98 TaxID=2913096 RepID=UPI001CD8B18C|nr:MetQ/NlpA family ABC transporter substrate-binding protein [Herbaspirillum sp. alder98]MCA1326844.1 methionine ABC transporter substrate-binding protein [Herbaspirillum sp. alder98]
MDFISAASRTLLCAAVAFSFSINSATAADAPLRVGASPGPYSDFLQAAAKIANAEGFAVKVIEFTEPTQINEATQAGDIDLNNFQHVPYMQKQNESRGYKIVSIKPSYVAPAGVYSAKYKSLDQLPAGAKVAVPNDPANEARALVLLQKANLIKLRPEAGANAGLGDVIDNPKKLKIVPLDEVQVPRVLVDIDAGVVTLNKGVLAGLNPKDALLLEDKSSLWAIIWAARADRKDDPRIARFIKIFESEQIKQLIITKFNGTVIPSW